ncbi:zinc-dependent metalloprotease [Actinotalea ferrariae]|uniref:zinc-dependent metalloprotease n=1 Tax=Actinotalea ferrariae TaxID=1386098 RepID=UPI001C8BC724|nr:zinc-dependent metalloprotease [Actinotalea ferrariae]MBX9246761.1 zinc-dependent metalloprotease [Actinotalea ferrariae]
MSTPPHDDDQGRGVPAQWEQLLRQVLGPAADDVIREMSERGGMEALGLTGPDGRQLDLAGMAAAAGLPSDPAALGQVLGQIQRMLATSGDGPVNWDLAHDLARQAAVAEGDPSVSEADRREVTSAFTVAELWLDTATNLPPAGGPRQAWSRSEWVEHTLGTWRLLAEPVAASVADALATALATQAPDGIDALGSPEAVAGGAGAMMRQLGGAVFGMQVGQAAGTLAREVFGTTDIGLPLTEGRGVALLPRNVAAFAEGLDVPAEEVRIFLAVREAAHARLFTHVTWLRAHLLGAVQAYARGITIDTDTLEEAVRSIDPTDPTALQEALSGGVFSLGTTPEQQAALARLETALALVEGWVDEVSAAATAAHLPHTSALREMMRRRRAAGGPAEDTFATLVGLELRPRRSRDAASLWARVAADGGVDARDAAWGHPDFLPTAEDLDDPGAFVTRRAALGDETDVDRAIDEIFRADEADGSGDAGGSGGGTDPGSGPTSR